jgi:ribosomal protein S18 acetylase RimI-like enzyme
VTVTLEPMSGAELGPWLEAAGREYVSERVAAGEEPALAESKAAQSRGRLFPGGRPAPGQHVFRILDDGAPAGALWIGVGPDERGDAWWVWTIEIDEALRGRGLARAAMLLAEDLAREHGASEIGLNVFGHNEVARSLYDSLGYEVASTWMTKRL